MVGWTFFLTLAIGLAATYTAAHFPLLLRWRPPQPPLLLLLILGLAVRWLFLVFFPNPAGDLGFDAESFRIVADLVRDGKDVYSETDRHPYLPFHMYVLAFSAQLGDWLEPHFFSWVRWPNILADLGILVLIYRGSLRLGRSASTAFWLGFLWAVQPISIFTSVLHGQFDSVAAFFALFSWYTLRFWPGYRGALFGGLTLGFAVLDKTWPGLFIPVFVLLPSGWRSKAVYVAAVAAVPLLFFLAYDLTFGTTTDLIRERVVDYRSVPERFGYTYAFRHYLSGEVPESWLQYASAHGRNILITALALVGAFVVPRRDALASAAALIATFYAFTFGFGSQYMIWIVPFALMGGQVTMLGIYSAAAIPALFVYYWGTCGLQCPGRLSDAIEYWPLQWIWPVAIFWMLREVVFSIPWRETVTSFRTNLRGVEPTRRA